MKARQLIGNASYDPKTLAILFKAFDDAWAHLAPRFSANALAIEAARLKLASIILSLGTADSTDAEQLKSAALRIMELDHRP